MKEFKIVAGYMAFPIGTLLGLSDRQASKRAHLIRKVDKGLYMVEKETGFKRGEIVKLDVDAMKVSIKGNGLECLDEDYQKVLEAAQAKKTKTGARADSVPEGQESEAQDAQDATEDDAADTEDEEKSLDELLAGMDKAQLKEALDNKEEKYHVLTGEGKLRAQLKEVMEKELAAKAKAAGEEG